MLNKNELEELLSFSLLNGGDFAEIFLERTYLTNIILEDGKLEKVLSGVDQGVGIRVFEKDQVYYQTTTNPSFENLRKLILNLRGVKKIDPTKLKKVNLTPQLSQLNFKIEKRPHEVALKKKTLIANRCNKTAREVSPLICQATVAYQDSNQAITLVNSDGTYVEDNRIRTRLAINVIAKKDDLLQTGYESVGGFTGFEIFHKVSPEEIAQKAAKRALLMLEAKKAPAGPMPVVLSSEAGGTMIHEACGHSLEADFILKQTSIFKDKIGQKIASELINVVDDGSLTGNFGSFRFDDEGSPSKRNLLIENGILKGFMNDRFTAHRLGLPLSGNGRRESFRTQPVPRMTNTFILPGKTDPQEILSSIKYGLLVRKMGGGQVNPINGDFVFEVSEGYLIEEGKIKYPVRGAILTGNGPQVLETIDMVGSDLSFQIGICGKYDHAPVSDGQPTLRIPEIIVGGHA